MADKHLVFSLEEKLKADHKGELKREIEARFKAQIVEIDKLLSRGVSPEEYSQLNQVKSAIHSASVILEKIWQQFHKDKT